MIDSAVLADKVNVYKDNCEKSGLRPTYGGLGALIGVSGSTICHIMLGHYCRNKPYTMNPSSRRAVDNNDFEIIRDIWR